MTALVYLVQNIQISCVLTSWVVFVMLVDSRVAVVHVGLSEDQRVIGDYNRFGRVLRQFRDKSAALDKNFVGCRY